MSRSKNSLQNIVGANVFLIVTLIIITIYPAFSQDSDKQPQFTVKIGTGVLALYGTDFYFNDLRKNSYFQPSIYAGLQYKQTIYLGIYGSKYMIFKKDYAYGLDRHILAGEIGIPVRNFIIGATVGQDDYFAPSKGGEMSAYEFKSIFLGVFVDYKVSNYLSIPVRIAYSADNNQYGFGNYWHCSIGLSGNILVY